MSKNSRLGTLFWLTLFIVAMAYVEAALVVHLRSLYYPDNPQNIFPLNILDFRDYAIELGRETATIIMILTIALLVEKSIARRFAAFVYIFGLWDLGYYAWLKVFINWPQGWLEWDVLFLIPWPWLGPWITAAAIALLFVLWGAYVLVSAVDPEFNKVSISLFLIGSTLGLMAFLDPAMPLLSGGEEAFRGFQPISFSWTLYLTGFALMFISLIIALRPKLNK